MYIIKENTFDIPIEDLRKILVLSEPEIFKYIPKWKAFNCKNISKLDFFKPIFELRNLQNIFTSKEILDCPNLDKLKIQIGFFEQSEYVSAKFLIKINLGKHIFQQIKDLQLDSTLGFSELAKLINVSFKDLKLKLSEERFLDSVAHELSHFLDDSNHSSFIFKNIKKAVSKGTTLDTVYNVKDINLSYMELNAQIHAIQNLKAIYIKKWDTLTIFDVIKRDASLLGLYRHFSEDFGKQQAIDWVKTLQKRMYREGLLGKNMTFIPKNDAILISETYTGMNLELQESCNIERFI